MNIKDLEYFRALVQQKNFSTVAEKFKVSQPTISQSVKRLEDEFTTKLFIRDQGKHQLEVTPSGQQLNEHVIQVLDQIQVAHEEIEHINSQQTFLGLPPIMTLRFFPLIAAQLYQRKLLSTITPVEKGSAELEKMLTAGVIDIALLGSIHQHTSNNFFTKEFASDSFRILVSTKSKYANQTEIFFKDLRNADFLTLDANFVHSQALRQLSRSNHFRPKIQYQSNDPQVIVKLVEQNIGIGFLATSAFKPTANVKVLQLKDADQPIFHMNLAYRSDHLLTPEQQQIVDIILNLEE